MHLQTVSLVQFAYVQCCKHLRKYMAYWQYSWDASYPLPSDEQDASYPVPSDEHKEERRIWMFDNLWYDWLPKKES